MLRVYVCVVHSLQTLVYDGGDVEKQATRRGFGDDSMTPTERYSA